MKTIINYERKTGQKDELIVLMEHVQVLYKVVYGAKANSRAGYGQGKPVIFDIR